LIFITIVTKLDIQGVFGEVSNIHPIMLMALALGLQPRGMGWKVPKA
jgi:hypothetical protein